MKGRKSSISEFFKFKKSEKSTDKKTLKNNLDRLPLCFTEGLSVHSSEGKFTTITTIENLAKSLAFIKIISIIFAEAYQKFYKAEMGDAFQAVTAIKLSLEKPFNYLNLTMINQDNTKRTEIRSFAKVGYENFVNFIKNNIDQTPQISIDDIAKILAGSIEKIDKAEFINYDTFFTYVNSSLEDLKEKIFSGGKFESHKLDKNYVRFPAMVGEFDMTQYSTYFSHSILVPIISHYIQNKNPVTSTNNQSMEVPVTYDKTLAANLLENYPACYAYYRTHRNLPDNGGILQKFWNEKYVEIIELEKKADNSIIDEQMQAHGKLQLKPNKIFQQAKQRANELKIDYPKYKTEDFGKELDLAHTIVETIESQKSQIGRQRH